MIAVSSCISGYFAAVRKVYKSVLANFFEYIVKIIITLLLLKKVLPSGNVEYICFVLILGDVFSEVCSFTYNIFILLYDLNFKLTYPNTIKKNLFLSRILKILMPVSLTSYIKSGLSTIKQLIIPSSLEKHGFECTTALSEYGTITGMAMPIIMFPATILTSISVLFIPEFSRYFVKKDFIQIKKYSKKILLISFLFATALTIFFIIFGNNLGQIFYKDVKVGFYIKIFAPIVPFMYIDIIIDSILKGLDAQVNVLFINIIDLLFSISFIFFFVPWFGIKGFIASIYFSEILNFILSLKKLLNLEKSLLNATK